MLKKAVLTFIIMIIALLPLFASGEPEKPLNEGNDPKKELQILKKAKQKWDRQKIKSYQADIVYRRAAFPAETFSIIVKNNTVTKLRSEKPETGYSEDFIQALTAEKMFGKMKKSLESGSSSPMTLKASYDENLGYIKKLSRVPSETIQAAGRAPLDAGYHIEITRLEIIEKEKR